MHTAAARVMPPPSEPRAAWRVAARRGRTARSIPRAAPSGPPRAPCSSNSPRPTPAASLAAQQAALVPRRARLHCHRLVHAPGHLQPRFFAPVIHQRHRGAEVLADEDVFRVIAAGVELRVERLAVRRHAVGCLGSGTPARRHGLSARQTSHRTGARSMHTRLEAVAVLSGGTVKGRECSQALCCPLFMIKNLNNQSFLVCF